MKKILIGIICVLIAVFGVLDAVGVLVPIESIVGTVFFWQILCGLLLLLVVIWTIAKYRLFITAFALSILFLIFERNVAFVCGLANANIINNWLFLLLSIIFSVGILLLFPKKRKKKNKNQDRVFVNGHKFGSNTVYVDCTNFREHHVENDMGTTTVKFENSDSYCGGGKLHIENNMGSTTILLPSDWQLVCRIENNLGNVKNEFGKGGVGPTITVTGENNMGSVLIKKV